MMKPVLIRVVLGLSLLGGILPSAFTADKSTYLALDWRDLMPPNWHPGLQLKSELADKIGKTKPEDLSSLLQERLKDIYQRAPTNPDLNNKQVKISGYIVPLDDSAHGLKEFLLVPVYGACIHVPPPPQNQIVYVTTGEAVDFGLMDAVTVWGRLFLKATSSGMGKAAYSLELNEIAPYQGR